MKEITKARIVGLAGGATALGAAAYVFKHRNAPRRGISLRKAQKIGEELGVDWSRIELEELRRGMAVELEHGRRDPATDVTGDDLLLTGKIALAHLKEFPDYYTRLAKMEEEAAAYWREAAVSSKVRSFPIPQDGRGYPLRSCPDAQRRCPMATTGLAVFDRTVQKTNE